MNGRPYALITRPADDAPRLVAAVRAAGYEPFIHPFLKITLIPANVPDLTDAQSLILTSMNAVRAVAASGAAIPDIPVYAVGAATAAAARAAGFSHITVADGDARSLAAVLGRHEFAPDAPVFHLCGRDVTPLDAPAVKVVRHVVYHADMIDEISGDLGRAWAAGQVGAVLLMSTRTGHALAKALEKCDLTGKIGNTRVLCLSDSVLQSVAHLPWGQCLVATRPDADHLCALLAPAA